MKALELAEIALTEWVRKEHSDPQVMLDKCAVELRRLAEVNAELENILHQLIVADENQALDGAMFAYAKYFLAKAKEQP